MIMQKKNIGFRIQGEFQSRCTGFQIVDDPSDLTPLNFDGK